MTQAETTILGELADPGVKADVAKLMVNDTLSYHSMLTILRDAAVGGMTASKFSTLETLASLLNAPGGIEVSGYVKSIAKSVIDGNPATPHGPAAPRPPSRSAISMPTRRKLI
jgi:hypothetical protein